MKQVNVLQLFLCLLFPILLIISCKESSSNEVQETSNISSDQLDIIGHWEAAFVDDGEVTEERLALTNEMFGGMMTYDFLAGNKVKGQAAGYESQGTYTIDKAAKQVKLLFDDGGGVIELQIKDSKLLLETGSALMSFTKVVSSGNNSDNPLNQMVLDRFDQKKKDRIYGLWELKRVSTRSGKVLSMLQQLEQGTFLSFHKDGTYTKRLSTNRAVNGTFTKVDKRLIISSELGRVQKFSITKLSIEVLTLQEEQTDIVRHYLPIAPQ